MEKNEINVQFSWIEKRIKMLCIEKGITLKELAESIGMSRSGFYVTLKKGTLTVEKIFEIADTLKVHISVLLGYRFYKTHDLQLEIERIDKYIGSLVKENVSSNAVFLLRSELSLLSRKIQDVLNYTISLEEKLKMYKSSDEGQSVFL